ncbi:hypothetical protein EHO66_00605 [Leptospira kmetyi]|uniref:hypothetical protein n=1 Tax=Leptospira kmetyi TaxID=408139 RepID=UPI0010823F48|nr:hypothetical protein [Leptospira kmetyi]TGK34411.1 hypothetical protein EHO66_00605 [Leptospira kmetyi]
MNKYIVLNQYRGWEISRPIVFGEKHTGVILGLNVHGDLLIAHNHIDTGPAVVNFEQFLAGYSNYSLRPPTLDIDTILYRVEMLLQSGKQYDFVSFNCQHFSSLVVDGKDESRGIRNAGILLSLIIGLSILGKR